MMSVLFLLLAAWNIYKIVDHGPEYQEATVYVRLGVALACSGVAVYLGVS